MSTVQLAPGFAAPGLFDGIDLDWEFRAAADKINFTALATEFRKQFTTLGESNNRAYMLTIAAPAGSQNVSNIQLAAVAAQLDFLNMETNDYHGKWKPHTHCSQLALGEDLLQISS